LTIASPDMGGSKERTPILNFRIRCICYKQRKAANVIGTMELIGDVKGKNVILVDDMIDTEALWKAADLMMEKEH
jgi:ribose-phosphate pyrophosphokinase